MNIRLKERVVGIIVVLGLILVAMPFFLKDNDALSRRLQKNERQIAAAQSTTLSSQTSAEDTKGIRLKMRTAATQDDEYLQQQPVSQHPSDFSQSSKKPEIVSVADSQKRKEAVKLQWSEDPLNPGAHSEVEVIPALPDQSDKHEKTLVLEEEIVVESEYSKQSIAAKSGQTTQTEKSKNHSFARATSQKPIVHSAQVFSSGKPLSVNKASKPAPSSVSQVKSVSQGKKEVSTHTVWSVRVAEFSQEKYARLLMERLRRQGFKPYETRGTSNQGNSVIQVWIGREIQRENAQKLALSLHKKMHMTGMVSKMLGVER